MSRGQRLGGERPRAGGHRNAQEQGHTWRRIVAIGSPLAAVALLGALGYALLYDTEDAPKPETSSPAYTFITSPSNLRILGLCAPELRAQDKILEGAVRHKQIVNRPLTTTELQAGAAVAEHNAVPCKSAQPNAEVVVHTLSHELHFTAADFAYLNAEDICEQRRSFEETMANPVSAEQAAWFEESVLPAANELIAATGARC